MSLKFPKYEDVPLAKPPLREVICQVRFPVILRIIDERPSEFQERIRQRFPELQVQRPLVISGSVAKPDASVDLKPPLYRFHGRNRTWTVSLAPDSYALSTSAYEHWPEFAGELEKVTEAVLQTYDIPYASRIGLRYINVIDRSFTKSARLEDVYALLRPELSALLVTSAIMEPVYAISDIRATTGDDRFTFRCGLSQMADSDELGFVLDFDCYAEGQLSLEDLSARGDRYHTLIYGAFRWCILDDEALSVFEPKTKEL